MKISVSLPEEDVSYLDTYSKGQALGSRSAAVHEAVRLLRQSGLQSAYADAYSDGAGAGDSPPGGDWDPTVADGLETDAPG
jgi:Arc/MetJ-type ribon-helix-helix transcriptional regulator